MRYLLVLSIALLGYNCSGQDFGFFGKKNIISVNGLGNVPLIYMFANNGTTTYKKNGSKLQEGKNLFDYGMNVSFSHAFSGKFALGFEYALNFAKCNGPSAGEIDYENNNSYYFGTVNFEHEQLSIRTMTYMPKIEYSMLGEQLPFGINNQFGIGFSSTKIIEKNYAVEQVQQEFQDPIIATIFNSKNVFNPKMKNLNGITVMYGFNVRTPISKNLLINYGIRYTLNASLDFDVINGNAQTESNYYVSEFDMNRLLIRKRITSVLAFNIGINYVF